MYVIGTAGHVDHGKSTLIEALTGIDPDRLAEEKEREMTIDLGFAWMTLELEGEGQEVGVVDVPGHRDFIENMLAGIGGIDLALFVVAADEGVMPQTREHLAIIDLLEISSGVVALTKTDLIQDPDWLELVTLDLHENLAGTVLEDAPIIPVSARSGQGLSQLRAEVSGRLAGARPRADSGRPRLPIDRVFTLSGFGTIVTGTLVGGRFAVGDAIEIQPDGEQGRIRGLQTHKAKREVAMPGSRVAVNVSGIDASSLHRGQVLAAPGQLRPTVLVDVQYRHLADTARPLKHNVEVKLFTGASEAMARTRVLGARLIEPGQSGWLQLALQSPVAVERGDRFILRRPSPGTTLGGGKILDPHPGRRHRRFHENVLERLRTLAEGTPEELLLQKLALLQPIAPRDLFRQSGMGEEAAAQAWKDLLDNARARMSGQYALSEPYWQSLLDQIRRRTADFHVEHPLRRGIPREELRNKLGISIAVFNPVVEYLVEQNVVVDTGSVIHTPEHQIAFNEGEQQRVDDLLDRFQQAGVNAPSVKESRALVGDDVYEALCELDILHQLNEEVVYRSTDFAAIQQKIVTYIEGHGSATAADIRDLLSTSRKYAIALLEYLDQEKVTRRTGDKRVLVAPRVASQQVTPD